MTSRRQARPGRLFFAPLCRWCTVATLGLVAACGAPQQRSHQPAPAASRDADAAGPTAVVNPALSRLPSRVRAALEDRRWADAARLLAQEQQGQPAAPDVRALQAVVALQLQEIGQAIAYAEAAWEALGASQPCAFSACDPHGLTLLLANVLGRAGLSGRTLELLDTLPTDPDGQAAVLRANASVALARHDEAAVALQAARRTNPTLDAAAISAIVADRQNDLSAGTLYDQALQRAPDSAAVWIHAGFFALASQDTALARQRLTHALTLLSPTDPTHDELRAVLESLAP